MRKQYLFGRDSVVDLPEAVHAVSVQIVIIICERIVRINRFVVNFSVFVTDNSNVC